MPGIADYFIGSLLTPRMIKFGFIALICLCVSVSVILIQIRQWFFFIFSLFIVFVSLYLFCHSCGGWHNNMVDLNEDLTKLSNEQCVERSRQLNMALTACLTQLGEDGRATRQRALHQEMLVIKSMEPADKLVQAGTSVDWKYTGPRPQYHVGGFYY
ncbi:hypothetical protein EKO04_011602 [Ascochyta lentis]|uniref:Uncharacterized protein n=1 Tax=Ascochyta lentis TaxID=205686 RepID=A0A8H7IS57_9PLEO|nr:hypothetical protein EKO04_011602 [Ascochyta lentis]